MDLTDPRPRTEAVPANSEEQPSESAYYFRHAADCPDWCVESHTDGYPHPAEHQSRPAWVHRGGRDGHVISAVVASANVAGWAEPVVRVYIGDDVAIEGTPAVARSVAAGLIHQANLAEGLTR